MISSKAPTLATINVSDIENIFDLVMQLSTDVPSVWNNDTGKKIGYRVVHQCLIKLLMIQGENSNSFWIFISNRR